MTPERHQDEYYYSLMLLYKPWRDEAELLEGFNSAQEAFITQHNHLQVLEPQAAEVHMDS